MTSRIAKLARASALALVAAGSFYLAAAASATAEEHVFVGFHAYHGRPISVFRPHELGIWRGGLWRHEWHNGVFGWWWFAGGAWYWYAQPMYPYPQVVSETYYIEPSAPGAVVQGAPASQSWWYCDNPAGYYPYVPTCSVPFRAVTPSAPPAGYAPPPAAAAPPAGYLPPPPSSSAPPAAPPPPPPAQ